MPKKDGTATKVELRQAEQYERIAKSLDRGDAIARRFRALGFEVEGGPASIAGIELDHEIAEQILDRLEGEGEEATAWRWKTEEDQRQYREGWQWSDPPSDAADLPDEVEVAVFRRIS